MIKIENLSVKLPDFSLKNIKLSIAKGDFFVLLGPTGTGKTVLLESIAGLQNISSGHIILNKKDISKEKPEHRSISICYQDCSLFPHMRVKDNIKYGLRFKTDGRNPKYQKNFDTLVDMLKITHILNRYPTFLSGGEKQRVALARALIVNPDVLLLDEPLSALDAGIKESIQTELQKLHQTLETTTIMVTHDFREAYYLANKVGIINNGTIMQTGSIAEVFEKPRSLFVAKFVGMKNIIELEHLNSKTLIHEDKSAYYLGIRPENIIISNEELQTDYSFNGYIEQIQNNGIYQEIKINSQGKLFLLYLSNNHYCTLNLYAGKNVHFGFDKQYCCYI